MPSLPTTDFSTGGSGRLVQWKHPKGCTQLGAIRFLHLKMCNHILHTTTKPKERASCEPCQQPPQQSSGNCLEWKGVWDLHHLPGRDTGYNLATAFKRGITCEMPVQSHSILIMCQACRFFLKAGSDKQKTKDSRENQGKETSEAESISNGVWGHVWLWMMRGWSEEFTREEFWVAGFSVVPHLDTCRLPRRGNRSWEDKSQDIIMVHISKYLSHL